MMRCDWHHACTLSAIQKLISVSESQSERLSMLVPFEVGRRSEELCNPPLEPPT
jgi:hypothetical protein